MPFSPRDRKAALVQRGVTQQAIADACGVDFTYVSHVVAGRMTESAKTREVMVYIAGAIGKPVDEVFPVDRRKSPAT
jgi:transcriptional regulator with XRE-family HTH domain